MENIRITGFFQYISTHFGNKITCMLKTWINYNKRIKATEQQLVFLLRCRKYDLMPPHIKNLKLSIKFHSNNAKRKLNNIIKHNRLKLLNLEIKFLRSKIISVEKSLLNCLPHDLVQQFFELSKQRFKTFKYNKKNNAINKFNHLKRTHDNECINFFNNIDNSKWLVNASNLKLPDIITNILSLGGQFALPLQQSNKNDRVNYSLELIKNFEVNSLKIPVNDRSDARNIIANSLETFLRNNKHISYIDRFIQKGFSMCKSFLHNNKEILVTRADKGQTTVILDRNEYVQKMEALLKDPYTYKKLKRDPNNALTNKLNSLVKSWRSNDLIDNITYKFLNCTNGNTPRCYGLPKIHKNGLPLRIIVSTLNSPGYNIANYIHSIIQRSIKKPNSHIRDGWSFSRTIKDRIINKNEIMISLDVTSLFTNIPKELVLKGIEKRWDDISGITSFNLAQFLCAVEVILDSTSFCFEGQFYEQIFGSPMGSPLSPILADIVMDDLESFCLSSLDFVVPIYYRYVDDIFAIVPSDKINVLLSTFNNYHKRLKFTYKIESNYSLNFLNTTVLRFNNKLMTNWFRKPTWSGRYINFHSCHPLKFKINTIYNLVDHAISLSDYRFHHENLEIVKNILSNNCFPSKIIKRYIHKRIKFLKQKNSNINIEDNTDKLNKSIEKTPFLSLPYVNNLSENMAHS